ncbi:MAG: GIY-YIG nuclease family protein [Gracilimonas sp.]
MEQQTLTELTFICEECDSLNYLRDVLIKKHNILDCQHCNEESYFTEGVEYIYVLDSKYSDLLKLGFTTREPTNRVNEINLATGAIPWEVAIYYHTLSGHKLEQKIYALFEDYRIQKKEQLNIELKQVVNILRNEFSISPDYIREDLEQIAKVVSSLKKAKFKPKSTEYWEGNCIYCKKHFSVTIYHDNGVACPHCNKLNLF